MIWGRKKKSFQNQQPAVKKFCRFWSCMPEPGFYIIDSGAPLDDYFDPNKDTVRPPNLHGTSWRVSPIISHFRNPVSALPLWCVCVWGPPAAIVDGRWHVEPSRSPSHAAGWVVQSWMSLSHSRYWRRWFGSPTPDLWTILRLYHSLEWNEKWETLF